MNRLRALLVAVTVAAILLGRPVYAARTSSADALSRETVPDVSDLRPPDPQKELRHLSRDLKLKKGQRAAVNSILEERSREIQLLLTVDSLSQEYEQYRDRVAEQVMQDSNAQIKTLLKNKQKRKFDQELASGHLSR
jgi:hypothetical protein